MRRSLVLLALPAILGAASPATREVTLKTPDGFTLKGTLTVPPGPGRHAAVILAHQFRSDRGGWAPLTEKLLGQGIATLALDLRGHGLSTDRNGEVVAVGEDFLASAKKVGFDHIPQDLEQAAAWLRKQPGIDGRRLGLAGSSVGALSALLAAPKVHAVAVLALSPAGNAAFGEGTEGHLKGAVSRARAAVFTLASEEDLEAWQNSKSLTGLPGVYAKGVPGKAHGFDFFAPHGDTMAVFLGEYLRRHAPVRPKAEVQAGTKLEMKPEVAPAAAAPAKTK